MSVSTVHAPLYILCTPANVVTSALAQVFSKTVIHGIESQHNFFSCFFSCFFRVLFSCFFSLFFRVFFCVFFFYVFFFCVCVFFFFVIFLMCFFFDFRVFLFLTSISPPILMSCSLHTEACNIRNHRWSHLSLLTTCTLTTARTL